MTALRAEYRSEPGPIRRLAVIAYHSSPLHEPGMGDAGGMTIYVRSLARALAGRGIQTDIFTRATADEPLVSNIAPGVRVIAIEAGPRAEIDKEELEGFVDDFVTGVRNFGIAHRIAYNVIHSHYWQSGLAAVPLARAWSIPLVHSHHTLGAVKNGALAPGDAPEPPRRLNGERTVINAASVLVASTSEEMEQLACLYGASHDNLKTVHPGVDHEVFRPDDRAAARAALGFGDGPLVLHVGRVQPLKGIDLAVRAIAALGPEAGSPELLVVGGPSGRSGEAELRRLQDLAAELGIAERVHFLGPRPHASLPAYYRAADVVVVCSHSESFGLAALEAQACGTPVVATAVGGLKHIVQDGQSGYLIDTRDPAAFAARLAPLLHDEHLWRRASMAAAGGSMSFSWDRAAAEFVELYECLVSEEFTEICSC
jgi:D-inositol-3-phosphate glycosyltransferase